MLLLCENILKLTVTVLVIISNYADCQRPLFEAQDKKPYNYYRIVDDPAQVKPDTITQDNLFSWLNLKNSVRFKLWTRGNPHLAHEIKYNNLESLRTSNFDSRRVTKILLHGYADTATEIAVTYYLFHMRDAYLSMSDVNVIVVDYSLFMIPIFYWASLPTVAAERLTEFVKFMVGSGGMNLTAVHMVGFSMGAHVAGIAGHKLRGEVGRITGLDPAGPTFQYLENEDRLDRSDARFVDIIHTNGGKRLLFGDSLGLETPLGHVDVYPNGGRKQIGCPLTTPLIYETLECSHGRSARYFIESITSPLAFPLPCPCDDFDKFIRNECLCTEKHDMSFMGEHMPHSTRGIYYIITKAFKPFGHGPQMNISLPDVILRAARSPQDEENNLNGTEISTPPAIERKRLEKDLQLAQESITIVYKNISHKVKHRNRFSTKEYPNDDIIYTCLELFLKEDEKED